MDTPVHIKCSDTDNSVRAFVSVYPNGSVTCSLPDGTNASLFYAGFDSEQVAEAKIVLSRCDSPRAVLNTMASYGRYQYSIF